MRTPITAVAIIAFLDRARALISAVAEWAAARGCSRVYWHTHQDNAAARLLYDKVAAYHGFIMYTLELSQE